MDIFNPRDAAIRLRQVGLQVTAQRLAVFEAVCLYPHITADELCQRVREQIGTISRQAVYNALHMMTEQGLIRRIQPAGSTARYEHRVDNHHHLVCRNCGRMEDTACAIGEVPCLCARDEHGYVIDEAEVIYWGLCPACQK